MNEKRHLIELFLGKMFFIAKMKKIFVLLPLMLYHRSIKFKGVSDEH